VGTANCIPAAEEKQILPLRSGMTNSDCDYLL
jgi:hypothetical protein